ncbi:MAG: hypothetical protein WBK19_20400 [Azonexus sp.]
MQMLRLLAVLAIAIVGFPVRAQSFTTELSSATYQPGLLLKVVPVYLLRADGRWSASLAGDLQNLATELVDISLVDGSARVLTKPPPGGKRLCLTKMKDRREFGYLECNSAFYSVNKGSAAAATLLRGVLSLGILTAADAASGNTSFTVSIDQPALDTAVAESKAVELAKEAVPLLEYRALFARATSPQQLRSFIATFEGTFDPESLVAKAKEKLPTSIAQDEARIQQKAAETAQRAEAQQQQEIRRQTEEENLVAFRSRLRPGDRVAAKWRDGRNLLVGMIVEMKPPLAYVQWENATPAVQWVRLESLLPSR